MQDERQARRRARPVQGHLERSVGQHPAGQEAVRKRAAADGKGYRLEREVNPSVERRRLVGEIVTWYQRIHTALTVKVVAPCESDPEMRREADEWATTLEERLTDEAPAGVRLTLLERALRRGVQPDRLLTRTQVERRTGLGPSALYRKMNADEFPRRSRLGESPSDGRNTRLRPGSLRSRAPTATTDVADKTLRERGQVGARTGETTNRPSWKTWTDPRIRVDGDTAGEGAPSGLRQRDDRPSAQADVAPLPLDDDPLDPAFRAPDATFRYSVSPSPYLPGLVSARTIATVSRPIFDPLFPHRP